MRRFLDLAKPITSALMLIVLLASFIDVVVYAIANTTYPYAIANDFIGPMFAPSTWVSIVMRIFVLFAAATVVLLLVIDFFAPVKFESDKWGSIFYLVMEFFASCAIAAFVFLYAPDVAVFLPAELDIDIADMQISGFSTVFPLTTESC